jgi:serine/threonine protein kinase
MLKLLGRRQDAHLVNLLATFSLKGRHYLLFPYAECNLREYWKRTPLPDFSEDTVSWTLGQCKAMISALHTIHEYRPTRPPFHAFATPEAGSPDTSDSSSENCIGLYGRHGDIKAENILWFCEEAMDERGDLVIADFGLTAFHKRATRSEIGHITGTPSYEAPETQLHSKISRAFDIWSLGCLYLEFVTWLVCGWEHLKRFPEARGKYTEPELNDDTFFTIIEGENQQRTAVVRQGVIEWISDLHEMPRCSAFIHDLLDLISAKMLVVNPKERILSGPLNNELKCMIDKGVETPLYLTAPRPSSPRPQQELQSSSLAAVVWNGLVRAPSPNEGMALPGRSSMASIPQISPGHLQSLDDISPPTSPRSDS